ncbi:FHA domain-containing protein [Leptolyngbya iicbica]|uniref:FHA domain-containing protein n=2 Tax=Cyanophyceae TaxID=3028117 RepID=A0A4Q7E2U6_9CYAN|nr:FHA domain-containing protein [Leptolyngbya sp. LK]RZM76112.1 FHA domain-containing protein [Leptolyngbya sp. LK]
MIVCPNCNHQNPDGAVQCEACYTPLPVLATCPSCQATVQSDASFCGQCGFDLRTVSPAASQSASTVPSAESASEPDYEATVPGIDDDVEIPELLPPEPLIATAPAAPPTEAASPPGPPPPLPETPPSIAAPLENGPNEPMTAPPAPLPTSPGAGAANLGSTQLQINQAKLLHVQTNTTLELPPQLTIIHLGKPNDRIPPTIDVSGFPDSEIVSRVHANLRVEGDIYYIEDVGSSNGTYVNNMPLPPGNRHRLRAGDRIALGKGDKVTFIFQSG